MPEKPTASHQLRTVKPASDTDGPTYDYRGAVILTNKQGTNCTFSLEGFPHGPKGRWGGLGNVSHIVSLVDAWLDTGKLSAPYVLTRTLEA
jgi:hypothetical protein